MLLVQIPFSMEHNAQVPMSLYYTKTVPVPADMETY